VVRDLSPSQAGNRAARAGAVAGDRITTLIHAAGYGVAVGGGNPFWRFLVTMLTELSARSELQRKPKHRPSHLCMTASYVGCNLSVCVFA
jgi:hypothetical protein